MSRKTAQLEAPDRAAAKRANGGLSPVLKAHTIKLAELGLAELGLDGDAVFGDSAVRESSRAFWAWWIGQGHSPGLLCRVMGEPEEQVRMVLRGIDSQVNDQGCQSFVEHYCNLVHNGRRPVAVTTPIYLRRANMDCYRMVEACLSRGYCPAVIKRVCGAMVMEAHLGIKCDESQKRAFVPRLDEVIGATAELMMVTPEELYGSGRHHNVVIGRSLVSLVGYELCDVSFLDLAKTLRGDRTKTGSIQTCRNRIKDMIAAGKKVLWRGHWVPLGLLAEILRKRVIELRDARIGWKDLGAWCLGPGVPAERAGRAGRAG